MSKSNPSLRKRLIGHSPQIQKIFLCVFGIALVFFSSFILLNSPSEAPDQIVPEIPFCINSYNYGKYYSDKHK